MLSCTSARGPSARAVGISSTIVAIKALMWNFMVGSEAGRRDDEPRKANSRPSARARRGRHPKCFLKRRAAWASRPRLGPSLLHPLHDERKRLRVRRVHARRPVQAGLGQSDDQLVAGQLVDALAHTAPRLAGNKELDVDLLRRPGRIKSVPGV